MTDSIPTLYEWAGGQAALERLTTRFYQRVKDDELIAPLFAHMPGEHPMFVAQFIAEVLGGPRAYSEQRGGHAHMIGRHLEKHLTEAQRQRWLTLLLSAADEVGLPSDPEFRSALVSYLEWGTRLAVINSHGSSGADPKSPMPKWGWGEVKGPYRPPL